MNEGVRRFSSTCLLEVKAVRREEKEIHLRWSGTDHIRIPMSYVEVFSSSEILIVPHIAPGSLKGACNLGIVELLLFMENFFKQVTCSFFGSDMNES